MEQTIFDLIYSKYKIAKPIRLIEFFAGYGSQALALKYLNVDFEHWKICEWAVKSIQAYKDIHFSNDNNDYSKEISKEQIIDYLANKGVSNNYNEPMTYEQIKRIGEDKLRTIYNNIIATHNLVNIQQVHGEDLDIKDTDTYTYLLTYSFPCQDLSNAGLKKGFSDTTTRSGMLWEVDRILHECKNLPQVLLMENVIQVHSDGENLQNFQKWQLRLEELGYKNYMKDLTATDYGIPQTRNRTFMVSILGDYNYTFPQPIPLELKLKDMLEDNVDESYYLSDAMIKCFTRETQDDKFPRGERFKQALKLTNEKNIAGTITTAAGNRATDNFVITKETENYIEWKEKGKLDIDCRAYKDDKVSGTIVTTPKNKILIKNATKKGYLEARDGDGIDLSQPNSETRRGRVQKEKIQTLTTQDQLGVAVSECKVIELNKNAKHQQDLIQSQNGMCRTICCGTHASGPHLLKTQVNNLRIRKLTPKECFRLMGVKDEDYEKCAKNQSNASLYHLAGDSIVVNVLMAIFKELI